MPEGMPRCQPLYHLRPGGDFLLYERPDLPDARLGTKRSRFALKRPAGDGYRRKAAEGRAGNHRVVLIRGNLKKGLASV